MHFVLRLGVVSEKTTEKIDTMLLPINDGTSINYVTQIFSTTIRYLWMSPFINLNVVNYSSHALTEAYFQKRQRLF